LKTIDKYILRSFLSPYLISFLVAEFVLVMQFLWKYIDEFAGKGFSTFDFIQLIFYYSIALIPMAVPITILISSVMVYGNLSEKYELSSLRSAGISLLRAMRPGIIIAILTFFFSLSVSNYFKPKAQFKFLKLFTEIRKKKPTLNILEKVFNKDFHGYAIQVNKKHKNGEDLDDIKLYDILDRSNEKYNITTAKKGKIFTTKDGGFFIMKLFDGYQYIEKKKRKPGKKIKKSYPLMRTHFDTLTKVFDMSEFNKKGSGHFFSKRRDLMNSLQIMTEIDSVSNKLNRKKKRLKPRFQYVFKEDADEILKKVNYDNIKLKEIKKENTPKGFNHHLTTEESLKKRIFTKSQKTKTKAKTKAKAKTKTKAESKSKVKAQAKTKTKTNKFKKNKKRYIEQKNITDFTTLAGFLDSFDDKDKSKIIRSVSDDIDYEKNQISGLASSLKNYKKRKNYWVLALHQQYSWAFVCIVFLFIGAPLGSIIRKGGYGYPVLVAIMFFTFFILLSISGDKFNKNMMFNPIFDAWIPVIVLLPISIFITFKALSGTKILDINNFKTNIVNFLKLRNKGEETT